MSLDAVRFSARRWSSWILFKFIVCASFMNVLLLVVYGLTLTWPLTAREKRKIETVEVKSLRQMCASGKDKIRNDDIRKQMGMHYIQKEQVKCFGYISRLPQNSTPQRALTLRCDGKKARGRQTPARDGSREYPRSWGLQCMKHTTWLATVIFSYPDAERHNRNM